MNPQRTSPSRVYTKRSNMQTETHRALFVLDLYPLPHRINTCIIYAITGMTRNSSHRWLVFFSLGSQLALFVIPNSIRYANDASHPRIFTMEECKNTCPPTIGSKLFLMAIEIDLSLTSQGRSVLIFALSYV